MHISIDATGEDATALKNDIALQIKSARKAHALSSAAIASLQDEIMRRLAHTKTGEVSVHADLLIEITVAKHPTIARLDGKPMEVGDDGMIHGDVANTTDVPITQ